MTLSWIENHKNLTGLSGAILTLGLAFFLSGCASTPDTSAPERTVVERSADWHGALLYIADAQGPDPDWGSVRIYDNVSGFVEKTVEQTQAAAPSDEYVTPGGSSMYVTSSVNGKIEKFRWDGNNWIHGPVIETPAQHLFAIVRGPDQNLYAAADGSPGATGLFYRLDPSTDRLAASPVTFPALTVAGGMSWSPDGATAYVSGARASGEAALLIAAWPSASVKAEVVLPGVTQANEVVTSPDGRSVYVMCRGRIFKVDPASSAVAATLAPAADPEAIYYDADFSADGRYMFTTATLPGGADSTLYVIDLTDGSVVRTVKHIGIKAMGIQRTE